MSVSLIRTSKDRPELSEEFPVATNATFEAHWLEGARALGLKLVPHLWEPFYPSEEERVELLRELKRLRAWAGKRSPSDATAANMVKRIDTLVAALESGTCDEYEFCFG